MIICAPKFLFKLKKLQEPCGRDVKYFIVNLILFMIMAVYFLITTLLVLRLATIMKSRAVVICVAYQSRWVQNYYRTCEGLFLFIL